jgi:EmrB/QacA subfamily drug resistance transporter
LDDSVVEDALAIEPVDYSKKWFALAAVSMGVFLSTIDSSIVNVALPTLVRELGASFPLVQWVVLAYLLTQSILLLGMGRWGDMIGKKPIYTAGFVIFTIGSVFCGISPTIYVLIASRTFQAVGAAMIFSLGLAIVTEAFPAAERGRALGIIGSVVSIGIVIGPTAGGFILGSLSWHWIFFVNLPVGILGTVMVLRYVPALHPAGKQRFDYLGALILFAGLMCLLLALTTGQQLGFFDPLILGLFAASSVLLALFVLIELRTPHPMIDLDLFRNMNFSLGLFTGFLVFVTLAGATFLMPFYLEDLLGFNTRQVGMLMAVVPLALGVTAPVSGVLSDRFGSRSITTAGLAILVFSYYLLTRLKLDTTQIGFILLFLPIGIGMGVFQSPNNSAVMGAAARSRLGVASGLLAITRALGQTTGVAVFGALWAGLSLSLAGFTVSGGVTMAPQTAQIKALQYVYLVAMFLVALAFVASLWGLVSKRRHDSA